MKHPAMNLRTLWNNIEARLDSRRPNWRTCIDEMGQLAAVEKRSAGRTWDDDEVFEALLMAVLSSDTDWSTIKRIQGKLTEPFSGFSLKAYADVSESEINNRLVPWFKKERAGSRSLRRNLVNLVHRRPKTLGLQHHSRNCRRLLHVAHASVRRRSKGGCTVSRLPRRVQASIAWDTISCGNTEEFGLRRGEARSPHHAGSRGLWACRFQPLEVRARWDRRAKGT